MRLLCACVVGAHTYNTQKQSGWELKRFRHISPCIASCLKYDQCVKTVAEVIHKKISGILGLCGLPRKKIVMKNINPCAHTMPFAFT